MICLFVIACKCLYLFSSTKKKNNLSSGTYAVIYVPHLGRWPMKVHENSMIVRTSYVSVQAGSTLTCHYFLSFLLLRSNFRLRMQCAKSCERSTGKRGAGKKQPRPGWCVLPPAHQWWWCLAGFILMMRSKEFARSFSPISNQKKASKSQRLLLSQLHFYFYPLAVLRRTYNFAFGWKKKCTVWFPENVHSTSFLFSTLKIFTSFLFSTLNIFTFD